MLFLIFHTIILRLFLYFCLFTYFQKALKINPNYTEALLNLTVLYNDLGKYEEAKKLYSHLKKKSGKQHDIEPVLKGKLSNLHAEIGDIYRSISLYPFAICEYEKALELNPAYLDIRTKLGQALRENGDLTRSKNELEQVVKANTHFGPGKVQLGVTLYCVDKVGEARKLWKQVIDKNPENEFAKMYLKLSEFQSQKPSSSEKKSASTSTKAKKKSSAKKVAKKKSVKKK